MAQPVEAVDVLHRNNVHEYGDPAGLPIVFAHGFGCSQEVWHRVIPHFPDHRVIVFDLVGSGGSDLSAYDRSKYDSLHGYADDLNEILAVLDLNDVVFVGHSVSAMIGILAANRSPARFRQLVLVGPSPRYLDDIDYAGGFTRPDIASLLDSMDANYLEWSTLMGSAIAGNPERPEVADELTASFCSTDPTIARHFARVTFLSDNRTDLSEVRVPTLVLQCTDDTIAPIAVGRFVHEQIPGSAFVQLAATGHTPNISGPDELATTIRERLR